MILFPPLAEIKHSLEGYVNMGEPLRFLLQEFLVAINSTLIRPKHEDILRAELFLDL